VFNTIVDNLDFFRLYPITEEEQKKIMNHIDELFDQGGRKDERHL